MIHVHISINTMFFAKEEITTIRRRDWHRILLVFFRLMLSEKSVNMCKNIPMQVPVIKQKKFKNTLMILPLKLLWLMVKLCSTYFLTNQFVFTQVTSVCDLNATWKTIVLRSRHKQLFLNIIFHRVLRRDRRQVSRLISRELKWII